MKYWERRRCRMAYSARARRRAWSYPAVSASHGRTRNRRRRTSPCHWRDWPGGAKAPLPVPSREVSVTRKPQGPAQRLQPPATSASSSSAFHVHAHACHTANKTPTRPRPAGVMHWIGPTLLLRMPIVRMAIVAPLADNRYRCRGSGSTGFSRLFDRLPDTLRGRRHVDMADLIGAPKHIAHRVHQRRPRADGAGLACAFDAERIVL